MKQNTLTPKAFRDTSIRILKKLTVVLLGVVAFFSLRALENAKTTYEKEKAQPIVIVDVAPIGEDPNQEFVVKLESTTLQDSFDRIIYPSAQALNAEKQKENSDNIRPVVAALGTLSNTIKNSIRDARRSPFENQEKFVEYLTGRINVGKDAADKQLSDTRAKRMKWFDELAAKYSNKPDDFERDLQKGSDSDFNTKFETAKETKRQAGATDAEFSSETLASVAKKVEQDRDLEDRKQVSDAAYYNIDGLHSKFVPGFLTRYVALQKSKSPHPSSISEMILEEGRGGHVIYQVFYMAFICVLVFGVLFPIYLLLGLFPAFSSGVEPLREQAKGFLTRRGAAAAAAPALMKTVALSAAAIGVGAAVVIANNPVTAPKSTDDAAIVAAQDKPNGYPRAQPPVRPTPGPRTGPGETPAGETPAETPTGETPTETPPFTNPPSERPINLYPTFYPTFKVDNTSVAELEKEYRSTVDRLRALEAGKLDTQAFRKETADFVTNKHLTDQIGDLPIIRGDVNNLKLGVANLTNKEIPNLRSDLKSSEANLSTKLDANTSAITGFREGTQGRSILSRARELLGRERYLVTPASYNIVRDLMCRQTDCSRSPEQVLLQNLRDLSERGQSVDKKTLQKKLRIGRGREIPSSQWEALILRYSRVPY